MIILEKPYVSDNLCQYLEETQTPVLKNAVSDNLTKNHSFNLLSPKAFSDNIHQGKRFYTTSEHALNWIYEHISDQNLIRSIQLMKDKFALRRAISPLYPDYFFSEIDIDALHQVDPETLPLPLVLKPSVGFFSVGVYVIDQAQDFKSALNDIDRTITTQTSLYPDDVVNHQKYILESYIEGDEYAIDFYYDETGQAVILNIMKHDFSSASDVSDRLYYTSQQIIKDNIDFFTATFNDINTELKVRNFPVHAEMRIQDGRAIPIEFNPMRFAGLCNTDIADFAFGIKTYDYFLHNRKPDWTSLLQSPDNHLYAFMILDKPDMSLSAAHFDYDALCQQFPEHIQLRRIDSEQADIFGFLFLKIPDDQPEVLHRILHADLNQFMIR